MPDTPEDKPARFVWTVSAGNLLSPLLTVGGIIFAISMWAGGIGFKGESVERRLDAIEKKVEAIGTRVESTQISLTRWEVLVRIIDEQGRQIGDLQADGRRKSEEVANLRVQAARQDAEIKALYDTAGKVLKR